MRPAGPRWSPAVTPLPVQSPHEASYGAMLVLGHRPALDGVRGIAVLPVVASHTPWSGSDGGGFVAVPLFFVLSGSSSPRHCSRSTGRRARSICGASTCAAPFGCCPPWSSWPRPARPTWRPPATASPACATPLRRPSTTRTCAPPPARTCRSSSTPGRSASRSSSTSCGRSCCSCCCGAGLAALDRHRPGPRRQRQRARPARPVGRRGQHRPPALRPGHPRRRHPDRLPPGVRVLRYHRPLAVGGLGLVGAVVWVDERDVGYPYGLTVVALVSAVLTAWALLSPDRHHAWLRAPGPGPGGPAVVRPLPLALPDPQGR